MNLTSNCENISFNPMKAFPNSNKPPPPQITKNPPPKRDKWKLFLKYQINWIFKRFKIFNRIKDIKRTSSLLLDNKY